jgi:predicted ATPase
LLVSHVALKNWRNFREVDVPLWEQTYIIGANATGKSNFLDVFRFLKDVSKLQGGGLQKAVNDRGGMAKLRCLHARRDPAVQVELTFVEDFVNGAPAWRYQLGFKRDAKHPEIVEITTEQVWRGSKQLLNRPTADDRRDPERLRQTHLEQIQSNVDFRSINEYFSNTTYLNLIPQLLKYNDRMGGRRLDGDPFGQGFLEQLARTNKKTREARLSRMQKALILAVPQFVELRLEHDKIDGRPHLEARYKHHRPNAEWQREDDFSDGTLRLISLLWSLLEGSSLLLLEEPEISLNDAIVQEIPLMIERVQRKSRHRRQIVVSTHSEKLLSNPGIDGRGVLIIEPTSEGSIMRSPNSKENGYLRNGLSVADVMLPKTRPGGAEQLGLDL